MRVYCGKLFGRFVKTEFYVSTLSCWRDNSRSIYQFLYFWTVNKSFSDFWLSFLVALTNWLLRLQDSFGWKIFFPSFSEFELMILQLLAKKVGKVIKTAFYVSRGTFWRETSFEKKNSTLLVYQQKKKLEFVAGSSVMDVKIFLLCVQRKKFFRDSVLRKKIIHCFFRSWEWMFQTFAPKLRAESSKLRFTYVSSRPIRGKVFLEKLCIFVFTGLRAEVSGFLWRNYLAEISNRLFTCPKGVFGSNSVWNLGFTFTTSSKKVRVFREKL